MESESLFIRFAWQNNIRRVPEPIGQWPDDQIACYGYISGKKPLPGTLTRAHILQAVHFITELNSKEIRGVRSAIALPMASEACFSMAAHLHTVKRRVSRLKHIPVRDEVCRRAARFAGSTLVPMWGTLMNAVESTKDTHVVFPHTQRIISPSDFGFHNAIEKEDGQLVFIDFEYAGWDDPAKLTCDFFCQVAVPVPFKYFDLFMNSIRQMLSLGSEFEERVRTLLPFYRLKWCCIMMNDFLETDGARKKFAAYNEDKRMLQLKKVREYADLHLS